MTNDTLTTAPSPLVLSETESARTIQLSSFYGSVPTEPTTFLLARFYVDMGCTLQRLATTDEPAHFELSESELDALVATWEAYKADREAAQVAACEGRVAAIAAAFVLAEEHGIKVVPIHPHKGSEDVLGWNILAKHFRRTIQADQPYQLLAEVRELANNLTETN